MPVQPKGSYGACPNPIWPATWCYGGTRTQNLLHKTTWLEHYVMHEAIKRAKWFEGRIVQMCMRSVQKAPC